MKIVTTLSLAVIGLALASCNTVSSVTDSATGAVKSTADVAGGAVTGTAGAATAAGSAVVQDVKSVTGN